MQCTAALQFPTCGSILSFYCPASCAGSCPERTGRSVPMDVGMMMIYSSYGWEDGSDGQMWEEELRLAEIAADAGFDCLWSAEHHFNDYSFVPDNLQLMTHLAARHPDIDVGTAAVILPWHNPAARGGKCRRSRLVERRSPSAGIRSRPGPSRVRGVWHEHGRIAGAFRRGGTDDSRGAQYWLHRGQREILPATADGDSPQGRSTPSTGAYTPSPLVTNPFSQLQNSERISSCSPTAPGK